MWAEWQKHLATRSDAATKAAAKDAKEFETKYVAPMVHSLTYGLMVMVRGQMSAAQFMENLWAASLQHILQAWLNEKITKWIMGKAIDTAANLDEVEGAAAVGGANAEAATSAIPIVGPGLAPAAGMAMYTQILGTFGPLASAAKGYYRVPFDRPVLTHKDEQILPADYAKGLRQLIAGGGKAAATTINISGITEPRAVADAVAREQRKAQRRRGA
jgi:hypothetical protein